jgi:hypothetical protein
MRGRLLLVALLVTACAGSTTSGARDGGSPESASTPTPSHGLVDREEPNGSSKKDPGEAPIVVEYDLIPRVHDPGTASFAAITQATLQHSRGWERADFDLVRKAGARFRVILAEGDEVDRLCSPYNTRETYSCQNGPVVALNADRWRTGTPQWTGTLAGYRKMLVNHEFGHLLGQHHPDIQCPDPGRPAPVMAQQSTELNGCLPNPWPLPHEIKRAARHDLPLAPPFEG